MLATNRTEVIGRPGVIWSMDLSSITGSSLNSLCITSAGMAMPSSSTNKQRKGCFCVPNNCTKVVLALIHRSHRLVEGGSVELLLC